MENKGYLDPQGNEIQPYSVRNMSFPENFKLNNPKTIEETAGKMARWLNLKDHVKELDGVKIAMIGAELVPGSSEFADPKTGEVHDYIRIMCFILDKDDKPVEGVVIMTGATSIVERVMSALPAMGPNSPVTGTLHAHGRAWLIE